MTLFHYTCEHGRRGVGRRGMLRPMPHPGIKDRWILWLTDQATPDRSGLGLTSNLLSCDRLQYRYIVHVYGDEVHHWNDWKQQLTHLEIAYLEAVPGARPELWFVSECSLLGILDRSYVMPREVAL